MECGQTWQPGKLTHVVDALHNSTRPLHVATDSGDAIMKSLGNPAGPEALAFELVGTELARWIGLKTPDFATLRLQGIPKDWCPHFAIEDGHAFLSRYMPAATFDGHRAILERLSNPNDIARLVVFDTWVLNEDRYPPDNAFDEKPPNLDNLMFARRRGGRRLKYDLIVFDHTHAFSNAGYDGLDDGGRVTADGVYGFFPLFKPYMTYDAIKAATDRLREVDADEVQTLLDAVPADWGLTGALKRVWHVLICERAQFVADTIEEKIIYQLELWKGGGDVK